jgi:hypothetical protein
MNITAAMAHPPKRKLCTLGRSANVAPAVLAKLLEDIGDELPAHCSRSTIMRARTEAIENINTPYGNLIQDVGLTTKSGSTVSCPYIDPKASLHHFVSECPSFAQCLGAAWKKNKPSPSNKWSIALYSDEVVPGHVCQWTTKESSKLFTGPFCSWARLLYHRTIVG